MGGWGASYDDTYLVLSCIGTLPYWGLVAPIIGIRSVAGNRYRYVDESLVIIYEAPDTGCKLISWCQGFQSPRATESDVVELIIEFLPIQTLDV